MDEMQLLKKELADEKKKVAALEQRLRLIELPGKMRGYYALQRIVNMQADFLNTFDLDKQIKIYSKDDKLYERASDLWEKLAPNISKLNALELEIGITGDEAKDTVKKSSFLDKAIG